MIAAVTMARAMDGDAIAEVHLAARAASMPWLRRVHTDAATRQHFAGLVACDPLPWWVVRREGCIAACMRVHGEVLDDLYVLPYWQGGGLGSALLDKAKALSPGRLQLWTFQRNARARGFYGARGFEPVRFTEGENEECEPDVLYEWRLQ